MRATGKEPHKSPGLSACISKFIRYVEERRRYRNRLRARKKLMARKEKKNDGQGRDTRGCGREEGRVKILPALSRRCRYLLPELILQT